MKILVLLSRFPYPLEKGDKLRAYHQIRHLSRSHELHLVALSDCPVSEADRAALKPYCQTITIIPLPRPLIAWNILKAFFSGKPLQTGYFYRCKAKRIISRTIDEVKPDHIFAQLIRVAEYLKEVPVPKTIDYQDVLSKGVDRRIRKAAFWMKPVLKLEYRRLLKYERMVFDLFDHKTIISYPDRDLIPHPEKEKISVIPNGVDFSFFSPREADKTHHIVFTGNMGYPPNVDAAKFLVKEILPVVHKEIPDARVMLAGATPHPDVKALGGTHVTVTGWMDDIRDAYSAAGLFIAPMRIGTGLQNKLLEAMAMKLPAITTPLANNALNAQNGKNILVGSTAEQLAQHIIFLLNHPEKAKELAEEGYRFVRNNFDWAATTRMLEEIMMKET
ncbi:MAG: TIGR03087 family PEP-CTERM/XrtA system glycosyltransferase [Bacteroidales bacterium]